MHKPFVLALAVCFAVTAKSQHLDIQVSDTAEQPVDGLKITTKQQPSSTEITKSGGKARIAVPAAATVLDLVIVGKPDLDFLQPWTGQVPVPPTYWPIWVTTKLQKQDLRKRGIVRALAARTNWSRASKRTGESQGGTREDAIAKTAKRFGLDTKDLEASFEAVLGSSDDPYDRGQLALLNERWSEANEFFAAALQRLDPKAKDPATLDMSFNAAFFMGQSLFGSGKYHEAVAAYQKALELHPNDPVILNSEGLSWSKAGDQEKATDLFERSLKGFQANSGSNLIDSGTINDNVGYTRQHRGVAYLQKDDFLLNKFGSVEFMRSFLADSPGLSPNVRAVLSNEWSAWGYHRWGALTFEDSPKILNKDNGAKVFGRSLFGSSVEVSTPAYRAWLEIGNLADTESAYMQSLNLSESIYGKDARTAKLRLGLADIQAAMGKTTEAVSLYKEVLKFRVETYGQESPEAQEVRMKLSNLGLTIH